MKLSESINIHGMVLKNRLVMPPMCTYLSDEEGNINDRALEFYASRTEGGNLGLVITEHFFINQQGKAGIGQISIADDSVIPNMRELTEVMQKQGTRTVCQINHAGSATNQLHTGMPIVGPSAVACPGRKKELVTDELPLELSVAEIHRIEDDFAAAAIRAQKAGYDGIEIHSAHGYLLNQFFSPLTNHRKDDYGCDSVENRVRFQVETIRKVRDAVGEDYPMLLRLGGCDYMEGGSTIQDAVEACIIFEAEGIDALDLTGGMCRYTRTDQRQPGYFGDLSSAVRRAVHVPVILAGGIKTAAQAEEQLQQGTCDLIAVGRSLLADASWARREMMIWKEEY